MMKATRESTTRRRGKQRRRGKRVAAVAGAPVVDLQQAQTAPHPLLVRMLPTKLRPLQRQVLSNIEH